MTADDRAPAPPLILDPSGRPARAPSSRICPRCGAGPERRVASGGFGGGVHDVCGACGYAFDEWTTRPTDARQGSRP